MYKVKELNSRVPSQSFETYEKALKHITDILEKENNKSYSFVIVFE